jgi:hypothetical protein
VFLGKYECSNGETERPILRKRLSGQMSSGQLSFWANVVRVNVSGQISRGKRHIGKYHTTIFMYLLPIVYRGLPFEMEDYRN